MTVAGLLLLTVAGLLLTAAGLLLPATRLLLLTAAGLLRRFLDFAQNFFYSIPQLTHNKVDSVQPFFMCRGKYMLSSNLIDCVVSRFVFARERAEVNGVGFQRSQQQVYSDEKLAIIFVPHSFYGGALLSNHLIAEVN